MFCKDWWSSSEEGSISSGDEDSFPSEVSAGVGEKIVEIVEDGDDNENEDEKDHTKNLEILSLH